MSKPDPAPRVRRIIGETRPTMDSLPTSSTTSTTTSLAPSSMDDHDPSQKDQIVCPICSESMRSLSQLNRHLDDEHNEVADDVHAVGIGSWLQRNLMKSTKLNPVMAITKSLRLGEDFERNGGHDQATLDANAALDRAIHKTHWVSASTSSRCSIESCPYGSKLKLINCRHCGMLFCEAHTMYQMKLSRSANYEPVHGRWHRVCKICYESRPWYSPVDIVSRDRYTELTASRRSIVYQADLRRNRMRKRLDALLQELSELDTSWWNVLSSATQRATEQKFVEWEDETQTTLCNVCKLEFSYSNTKHHCRLCGLVVCSRRETRCSTITDFDLTRSGHDTHRVGVRICKTCETIVFGGKDNTVPSETVASFSRLYDSMLQYESAIQNLLPRFQKTLRVLESQDAGKADVQEATRIRKKLLDAFNQYDTTAKKCLNLQTDSSTQLKLQKSVYTRATMFLQRNMVPLQTLSQVTPKKAAIEPREISMQELKEDMERARLQEELMAFKEQHFLLTELTTEAAKKRRFEEVSTLQHSLHELSLEIAQKEEQLAIHEE